MKPSRTAFWIGWVLTAVPSFMLLMSAVFKFIQPEGFSEGVTHLGWPVGPMFTIGLIEVACCILFLIPRTAILGGILVAAYLGGAVATHVRVSDPYWIPVALGVMAWIGLYLREPRLRRLVPFRS